MLKIYVFSPKFSAGGLCDWGILLVISLEFQGNKASTVFYDTAKRFFMTTLLRHQWNGRYEAFIFVMKVAFQLSEIQNEFFIKPSKGRMPRIYWNLQKEQQGTLGTGIR